MSNNDWRKDTKTKRAGETPAPTKGKWRMSIKLEQTRGVLGLALGAWLFLASAAPALQPPRAGELDEAEWRGDLKQRVEQAKAIGNHRADPRLVWRLRKNLLQAIGADDRQIADQMAGEITDEIVDAPPPAWQGGLPASGTPKVFVLLVDFPEYPHGFSDTRADIQSKFFGAGDASKTPYESLRSFYERSSYGRLSIQGNVFDWYRARFNRSYYEGLGFGKGQEVLMREAIQYWDSTGAGHDFRQYDNDNDGTIDGFFIKWTGPDNGWASFWWAYQWSWHVDTAFRVDGKQLGSYVWSWLANPVGSTYQARIDIHETGHLLGLPDLYDYNGNVGPDGGVGDLDMMDANWGDHNYFSKYMLGWLTPIVVGSGSQTRLLGPSGNSQDCVLVMPGAGSGMLFGEFFMAQYRRRGVGNDPANYPTDGMVIWHVDSRLTADGRDFLYDNSYTAHKYLRLMEADGLQDIEQNGYCEAGDFYRPPMSFGSETVPNSRNYAGQVTGVRIDELGEPGDTMAARVRIVSGADVVVEGWTLSGEDCLPANGAIDPYETVTLNIRLRNVGLANTSSLTATLLPAGGVASPSGPAVYGVLQANGSAIGRNFTLRAEGLCGRTIRLSLQLQNGATSLGTISFDVPLGAAVIRFAERFDGVVAPALPGGWSAQASGATSKWSVKTTPYDSAPNCVFAPNPDTVSDNLLQSPPMTLSSASARLTFRHRFDLESGYDGGVLEISVANGEFMDILAAGGWFESGAYNGSISYGWSNPLGGRQAWTGYRSAFSPVVVNLPPALLGQTVRFRWRLGTDSLQAGVGWFIDTVVLEDGFGCCDPLAVVVSETQLVVPEGSTATFGVKLASAPSEPTIVTVSKSGGGDPDLNVQSGSALTFDAANWSAYQPVTVAAAEDLDAISGQAIFICQAPGLHPALVVANEADRNSYDLRVLPEVLRVPENGTATMQIKLGARPAEAVNVSVAWVSGDADITVESGAMLTFTPDNWDAYQPVILAAAEDADAVDQSAIIVCSAPGWPDKFITAVEDDNDVLAVEIGVPSIAVPEGGTASFAVRLTAAPLSPLTIGVARDSGDTSIKVKSGLALRFAAGNYDVWQTVTLSADADADAADGRAIIRFSGTGMETKYLDATEIDDDTMEIVLAVPSVLVPEGYTAGFPIKLGAAPLEDTFVAVSVSGDADLSLLSTAPIRFTPADWDVYKTVTLVAGQDDDAIAGQATVRCSSPGMSDKTLVAIEADDDALAIVSSVAAVDVPERGTAGFTVRLGARPDAPLTLKVEMVAGDADLTLASSTALYFSLSGPDAWNVAQSVVISAARDADTTNGHALVRLSGPGLTAVEVAVREADDGLVPILWHIDADGDGAGDPQSGIQAWDPPFGYVADGSDCDDTNSEVHPGAVEQCDNARDDDCDGEVDENCIVAPADADSDGVTDETDRCPNTPFGMTVGADGCPPAVVDAGSADSADSDADGVPDRLDQCPNTPAGGQVDGQGCSIASDAQDNVPEDRSTDPPTLSGDKPAEQNPPSESDDAQDANPSPLPMPMCGAGLLESVAGMWMVLMLLSGGRRKPGLTLTADG